MLFLIQDVPLDLFHLRLTHGKRRVAGLSTEAPAVRPATLNPAGRIRLKLSHQGRKGKRRWLSEQHVHMIGGTVHQQRLASQFVDRRFQIAKTAGGL